MAGDKAQVVVIGAGPGGYAAAFQAATLGLEVTLVNAEPDPGGVCLHRGCIPSKALLHVARLINESREAEVCGLSFGKPKIDLDALRAWKSQVVKRLAGGVRQIAGARKVRYLAARASFLDSTTLALAPLEGAEGVPERLSFEHCILASGSRPAIPGPFQIDDERIMNSTGALNLPDVPKKLLVIGGGYIGLEMGTIYQALGSEVTVVELTDGLLPGADRDLVKPLHKRLEESFKAIHLKTRVEGLEPTKQGIKVKLSGEGAAPEMLFDRVLIAVGRRPNSEGLGLERTGVQLTEKGFVKVDRQQRTGDERIFAIGDVAGEPMLAHKASREAKVAAEVIAGHRSAFEVAAIPAVVFTDPELAWAGLTENEAAARGIAVKVARFPWAASGRAATLGRTEGLTKLVIEPESERVLGVGMVGPNAGDMIAEGALAIEMAALARDVADTIHPHPTLSETLMEAAELYFGQATHMVGGKR
ncbi:MAG TPA: dihydrolipoyl dehydrogenase [Candidatus Sumerlaeota bacterium]|nr:MAG: Dihydrolipoyl dehydrogenase [candidate division BRC1 bacterium ADurb.BinA292]HOR27559.1 dihydrolipoyl dehydrogenase [Candidatus Sumerlaeota bacterium]HPK01860.1 dihydrolipoyl dehydrogenase [Candidatus Sumerlaeota bacterium]